MPAATRVALAALVLALLAGTGIAATTLQRSYYEQLAVKAQASPAAARRPPPAATRRRPCARP